MKTEDKFQLYTSAFCAILFGALGVISLVGAIIHLRADLLFPVLFCVILCLAGYYDARKEYRKFN